MNDNRTIDEMIAQVRATQKIDGDGEGPAYAPTAPSASEILSRSSEATPDGHEIDMRVVRVLTGLSIASGTMLKPADAFLVGVAVGAQTATTREMADMLARIVVLSAHSVNGKSPEEIMGVITSFSDGLLGK